MKRIEFGFNNDELLNHGWSGTEHYSGDYLGIVNYEGMDFLITKVISSMDPKNIPNGRVDVKEITQDYFANGDYYTYSNKQKNTMCQRLEELLNKARIKEKVLCGVSPIMILNGEGIQVGPSHLRDVVPDADNVTAIVTSVRRDVFDKLKASKKYFFGKTIYDMTVERQAVEFELMRLRKEIEKLQKVSSHSVSR